FDYDHDDDRKEIIRANVLKYNIPLIYCNTVGSQTEIVFDGGSLAFDKDGNVMKEMKYFEEDFLIVDMEAHFANVPQQPKSTPDNLQKLDKEMRAAKVNDPNEIISYL